MLPEPPDGLLKSFLSLTLILLVHLYPVFRGLLRLWGRFTLQYISSKRDKCIFVKHGRRRRKRHRKLPTLHIKLYATDTDPNERTFSWDTDGIPFVVDNSATAIISNERRLFNGHLTPNRVTLETAEGVSTRTQLVGIFRLVLTDNENKHHTYDVPGCVFDPATPLNILGVPALGTFFGDNADASNPYDEDGTTIKSGATRSHFVWDNGRHERHFMHGSSRMPELLLYVGHGYFNAFCTRIHKLLSDKVHYAFSSAYSIDPSAANTEPHVIPAMPGDMEGEDTLYQWYSPTAVDTPEPTRKSS